jgi:transketolase
MRLGAGRKTADKVNYKWQPGISPRSLRQSPPKALSAWSSCWSGGGKAQVILIGTGSEVYLCIEAFEQLKKDGIAARVVSLPSWELFERQSQAYRDEVLPPSVTARVAVEQGSTLGWARYVGINGTVIGMKSFGASAPFGQLQKKFGFTVENIVAAAKAQLAITNT